MTNKLIEIINHAYRTVPLYRQLYSKCGLSFNNKDDLLRDYKKIPLLTKSILLESEYSNISEDAIDKYINNDLIKIPTSGSTGRYLDVYWDELDYRKSLLPLWMLRKKRYNVLPKDKKCFFYTNQYDGNRVVNCPDMFFTKNELLISKNQWDINRLKNILENIIKFSPKWMILQPSIAILLSCYMVENCLELPDTLNYIELTGEMLFKSDRKKIENAFNCIVANQYGTNEVNSIAFECGCGNLHILEECNYVEIIENGKHLNYGEEGNIYVTSLCNFSMPFIRYEIGDKGVLYPYSECRCGCKSPILKLTKGRNNDLVLNENKEKIHPYIFVHSFEIVNDLMDGAVRQFQVIQEDYESFIVKIAVEASEYTSYEKKQFIINLFLSNIKQQSLFNARFYFEFYNMIFPNEKTGKLQYFICKIKT